jgi:cytochrome P450
MTTALPPGPRLPQTWQKLALRVASTPFIDACHRRYGDVVHFNTKPPLVTVFDPELSRQVMHTPMSELTLIEESVVPFLGEKTMITTDGEEHLQHRRRLSPALRGERLHSYAGLMRDRTDRAIRSWPVGEAFALLPHLRRLTLEVIADVTLGPGDEPWREELLREVAALAMGHTSPARVEELLATDDRAERFGDQTLTLLVSGSETTATTLAWAFELLLRHPAALDQLDDERYLAAAIEETLRLRPPVPHVRRRVREAPYALDGFVLAPGTEIRASVGRITDPEFRPERHLEGSDQASLPFGAGPHRCIGASYSTFQIGIVLRRVFETVQMRLVDRRPEKSTLDSFTNVPARGVRVIAEPRC